MAPHKVALSALAFTTILMVLAAPATATENKLLLVPDNSIAIGYGGCVNVDIYTDINETDNATATQFDIEYDSNCVRDFPSFDNASSGWLVGPNASVTYSNPASGICRFTTILGPPNPPISGHIYVGTLTLCCNDTGCESFLNFANALYVKGDINSTSPLTDNGTFECKEVVCGDVTGDDAVNMGDVTKLLWNQTYWGQYPVDPCAADVTGGGGVNMGDVTKLLWNQTYWGQYPLTCPC